MVSILKRSLTSFRLMVLKTSACIDASEARTKAKLSTDICKSYDNIRFINGDFVATVVKSDDVGTWGDAGVDDEQEEVITGKICCGTTPPPWEKLRNNQLPGILGVSLKVHIPLTSG